jgi:PAS domain S-box-containing protein
MDAFEAPQEKSPQVLIVDDDLTMRLLMREVLEQAGFTVEEAGDGRAAISLFIHYQPDIILLDVLMPGMDGFVTCTTLRSLPGGAHLPIVLVTGLDDIASINRAYQLGATDFITKPINWPTLGHRIHYTLRASRAIEALHESQVALRTAHNELEHRVEERTFALAKANTALQQEIRERKLAEEALQKTHQRLRFHVENSPLAVIEWDHEFRIQRWSSQAEHILGWTAAEVLNKHPFEWSFVVEEDEAKFRTVIDRLLSGNEQRLVIQSRHYTKDGTVTYCEWYNSVLFDDSGAAISILSLVQDITERTALDRLKEELLATVSHELRTPLTSLRGFAELMLTRTFSSEQQRQFLTIIHNESTRLTDLINDFLDLQRIETGKQNYRFEVTALEPLLQKARALFHVNDGVHTLRIDVSSPLPPVRVDTDRIHQVLTNLLSNAIKFSPEGGDITIGARQDGGELVVWVADSGIGIAPELHPKLFSKFFRVDNTATRSVGGTGLGLALVQNLIAAHGGRIWVESASGKGSTFFFTLCTESESGLQTRPAVLPVKAKREGKTRIPLSSSGL